MATYEYECRQFAAQFPTPNVLRGIGLAESGRISWRDLYTVAVRSLSAALEEVK